MATMVMALRVVVPPHPLIGHWLGVLRDRHTPSSLYASATAELGRWLTYEAVRDWLPHRRIQLETPLAAAEADVVDPAVPLLALPLLTAGLGLWQGGQTVLPSAQVLHLQDSLGVITPPAGPISSRCGVLLFVAELGDGESLLQLLDDLSALGVTGDRLRVITSLASGPGLKAVGERHGSLTIYAAGIDPDLNEAGAIVPGIGDVRQRLFGGTVLDEMPTDT
ncbi:uracil phosphoribosyltransferase [Cyanobium sp. WKJ7-Wakatipu]|uniref:uracil phosphoribosyltransferase n=1 Tax=Cyanobium sp. WKJ7-Wakatipu TaxID=2823726 RepID=UPI0028F45632|nr:uracil phosphoribosyltransferase [Cyanobium sp. WKJ7-Wakatipu]